MMQELREVLRTEINYTFSRRAIGGLPGIHQSNATGAGLDFRNLDSVANYPDLRRIDWIATARSKSDPPLVRIFEQQKSIEVLVIADLSASVGFSGLHTKLHELAKFVACLGYSTYRSGDHFGFIGYSDGIDFVVPAMLSKTAGIEIAEKLWNMKPSGKSHEGLRAVPDHLSHQPKLIFWVSDFHNEETLGKDFLSRVFDHEVIPVIISDEREYALPAWGITQITDPETNAQRLLFLTPRLSSKIKEEFFKRRAAHQRLFSEFNRSFFEISGKFDPRALNHFFEEMEVG